MPGIYYIQYLWRKNENNEKNEKKGKNLTHFNMEYWKTDWQNSELKSLNCGVRFVRTVLPVNPGVRISHDDRRQDAGKQNCHGNKHQFPGAL